MIDENMKYGIELLKNITEEEYKLQYYDSTSYHTVLCHNKSEYWLQTLSNNEYFQSLKTEILYEFPNQQNFTDSDGYENLEAFLEACYEDYYNKIVMKQEAFFIQDIFKHFIDELRLRINETYAITLIDTETVSIIIDNLHRRLCYHITLSYNKQYFQITFEKFTPIRLHQLICSIIKDINKLYCDITTQYSQIYIEKTI